MWDINWGGCLKWGIMQRDSSLDERGADSIPWYITENSLLSFLQSRGTGKRFLKYLPFLAFHLSVLFTQPHAVLRTKSTGHQMTLVNQQTIRTNSARFHGRLHVYSKRQKLCINAREEDCLCQTVFAKGTHVSRVYSNKAATKAPNTEKNDAAIPAADPVKVAGAEVVGVV
jgi:hypothetical protein